jgi:predicted nucleic acid-binding protein
MATYYFDSSALVKYYIPETGSAWVSGLIETKVEDGEWQNVIAIAKVGIVEVAAAAAKRRRMKDISERQQHRIVARFLGDCSERFTMLRADDAAIKLATDLTQRHPLRGYDAIHLAIALILNKSLLDDELPPLVFLSADIVLYEAAQAEGLLVGNPNEYKGEEWEQ